MKTARLLSTLALLVLGTGCIKSTLLNGQIKSTREASSAIDTLHDFEIAKYIAQSGIAQFEGMHKLAPDNTDALFMLVKGWTGLSFAFIEDEMEMQEDLRHKEMQEYHRLRAVAGYERALEYGKELLEKTGKKGFADAKKNDGLLRDWLKKNFTEKEDAVNLFWVGYAWLAKTNMDRENNETVGELFVGIAIMERSVELDETYNFASGLTVLAAYHARTALAELDQSGLLFQKAMGYTQNRSLIQKFNYATKYLCGKGDKEGYLKALTEIVAAGDIMPEQRLTNAIAKRRARRYLSKTRLADARENCGFGDMTVPVAPPPPADE